MGCGASAATQTENNNTPAKFDGEEEVDSASKLRDERKNEVLSRYKLSDKEKGRIVTYPIFKIPTKYLADEHTVECVFFATKDETCTDVTVFFLDKDHESEIVERQGVTFSLVKSEDKQSYVKAKFDHTWAGTDTWESLPNDESHTHTEGFESFERESHPSPVAGNDTISRPVVYVNTATHLLSNADTNNCTEHTTFAAYPCYSGNPNQATEVLLKVSEAVNPDKKEVSALAQLIPVRTTHAPSKKQQTGDKDKKKQPTD
eukprot:NODE_268_length_1049_cov_531.291757_g261_i0.p1 GENE.NODE_268_length_1049_cov_531.291757_g261_i0~~NODE_268_length_1049_cov_531.291757_g261_i0.p1  ORF type:complete len:260 (+),score=48.56 NODE_268_length_1049_cov_531.291757_g261_i0:93-872(+)